MKLLIVARCKNGMFAPFITEQVEALKIAGVECSWFGVEGKGFFGYLRHLSKMNKAIKEFRPDMIHAHYGLCGLLANLQRRVPVVTTYHGSDINNPQVLKLSKWSIRFSAHNVFVSQNSIDLAKPRKAFSLIPCGIDPNDYPVIDKVEARRLMLLSPDGKLVLFSGAYDNRVKNASLAKAAIDLLPGVQLIELKGFKRTQVATLMQAVDALVITSFTEGSPQVIKEAMACGCPIVSVDVGDVKDLIKGIDGCYIAERNAKSIADNLSKAIAFGKRTEGRSVIIGKGLTNDIIASKLIRVYNSIIQR